MFIVVADRVSAAFAEPTRTLLLFWQILTFLEKLTDVYLLKVTCFNNSNVILH